MRRLILSIAVIGWLSYISSFLLIAVTSVEGVGEVDVKGWSAMVTACGALHDLQETPVSAVISFLAALSNLVMLSTPWTIFRPSTQVGSTISWAMLVATLVNVGVFVTWLGEIQFGPGYVVWVGSFILLTISLLMARIRLGASGTADLAGWAA